jgi:hypothetical protein
MLLCLVKYSRIVNSGFFPLREMVAWAGCWIADKTGMGHEGRLL